MIMSNTLTQLFRDERGGTAIEYGLIASLIVIASIGAFESVANENTGLWGTVEKKVEEVMSDANADVG